ncbi:menaquinone biosynthetic enzyme MqnA/MqnD family protein [Desulforegula conservatrix]|uniref:menaquinone biosynthetic enzyme MqnA/MqnD family protein n=1 Tax=Desulforegula conservatrix TaxID=153026 RepID=UPI00040E0FEB|nr:menaquinone biosynthesis protein [Desulforegula conservatrix]
MRITESGLPEISIGHIKYMNVAPVNFAFDSGKLSEKAVWRNVVAPPAELNRRMEAGELDISSVSAAAYAFNSEDWLIIPGLSIGCTSEVMSVILASECPIEDLDEKKVALTLESDSAANLMKIIFAEKGVVPVIERKSLKRIEDAGSEYSAALIIGDSALTVPWENRFRYVFDLCTLWHELRNLPFVFGVWTVRKTVAEKYPDLVEEVASMLRKSLEDGLLNLDIISQSSARESGLSYEKCRKYFSLLDYRLPEEQVKGLGRFYDDMYSNGLVNKKIKISMFG